MTWIRFLFLSVFFLTPSFAPQSFAATKAHPLHCPICGMAFTPSAKARFITTRKDKTIELCSFACASRFHQAEPNVPIEIVDFVTGAKSDSNKAYYLVRSNKILAEFEFDMPPTVVSFATKENAEKTLKRLGDGKIVQGFDAALKAYN